MVAVGTRLAARASVPRRSARAHHLAQPGNRLARQRHVPTRLRSERRVLLREAAERGRVVSSLDDDLYASDPTRFESEVWGDVWAMDPERHTTTDRWAPPFADIEDDWTLWP